MKLRWKPSGLELFAAGLLFAGVTLTGCYSSANDPIFSDNPQSPGISGAGAPAGLTATAYTNSQAVRPGDNSEVPRFHVGDIVTVTLTGLPEVINPHQEPIKEDGTITMPYIGHIRAAGKTAGELQNEIHDLYVPKYYRHLTVTVNTGDRVYYVTGEVKQPGRQLYAGQMTVTKAITTVGGFTDFASHKKVWLIRAGGQRIKVNCDKAFQDPSQDPLVYPNDQIQVPRKLW
jgi:protein involved in polysaccharide export with SLBB domain